MNIKTANEYYFFIILKVLRKYILYQNYAVITKVIGTRTVQC